MAERPFKFDCAGASSIAILHEGAKDAAIAVLIIVGGPQYRVGSHRQFVLLARALAAAGYPTLRFDHRGTGDTLAAPAGFDSMADDIRAATDLLVAQTGAKHVVLWGLCDGASAAMMYAPMDPRIKATILLNPWVHNEQTEARVRLKTYYLARLRSRDFWRRVIRFDLDVRDSLTSLVGYAKKTLLPAENANVEATDTHFLEKMLDGLERFSGRTWVILSGNDLTADEFRDLTANDERWKSGIATKLDERLDIPTANHTFASREWRGQVEQQSIAWLRALSDSLQ